MAFDAFADLISQLDEVENPVSGETYLDNTVILFGTDHGNNAQHGHNLPVFMSSGRNGPLRTGKVLDFYRYDLGSTSLVPGQTFPGRPYTQVLSAIASIYGVDQSALKARTGMRYNERRSLYNNEWDKPLPDLLKNPA